MSVPATESCAVGVELPIPTFKVLLEIVNATLLEILVEEAMLNDLSVEL